MGIACTIILLVTMAIYAYYKIDLLSQRKSVDILQALDEDHFDDSYVFGAQQGLNFALAVTNRG